MRLLNLSPLVALFCLFQSVCNAKDMEIPNNQWRYTFEKPANGWETSKFDDQSWEKGEAGFGTEVPNSRVSTKWTTKNIWLRKEFVLESIPQEPVLVLHHDEDSQVYLNGQLISDLTGYTTNYEILPLNDKQASALVKGQNLLAIHCSQTNGGQYIDAHIVPRKQASDLVNKILSYDPFPSDLITTWGVSVNPQDVWAEYPRPQLERESWKNLNGNWDYSVTSKSQKERPSAWEGQILVPFSLESKLSGVQRLLEPSETLWYRRTFDLPKDSGKRVHLNFEAVDYACQIFLNDQLVGSHVGGNLPFSVEITDHVRPANNEIIVRVEDSTGGYQLRGKQALKPEGIWYTRVSGIWQTVWLETTSENYIEDLKISTNAKEGTIDVKAKSSSPGNIQVRVLDNQVEVASGKSDKGNIRLTIPDAKLWSPDSPHLYELDIVLTDASGATLDRVTSYAGIRDVGKVKDAQGNWRFTLNGKEIFHWGPLDQGWWPDGLLTPPSDEAMVYDIQWLKKAGFNMIRKHIKVEPRRYYYACDRLGMLLWQDQVSGGTSPKWTHLAPNPSDAQWPEEAHKEYMVELDGMISHLENHPSIVCWVPFNEAWGQHSTVDVGRWTAERDPSRLVNIASGGNFWPVGDIVDQHSYPDPGFPFGQGKGGRFDDFVKVVGEFGGHGLPIEGHLWDPKRGNWGYGGLPKNETEWLERYQRSIDRLVELRGQGIAAGVYTQTTDVEGEINGLLTYDRKVSKIKPEDLHQIHKKAGLVTK